MAETRKRTEPTSHTVTPPAAPLPAPPDPVAPAIDPQAKATGAMISMNLGIVRMWKELHYFQQQLESTWEILPDFDERPNLTEILDSTKRLAGHLQAQVDHADLAPRLRLQKPPGRIIANKSD